MKKSLRDFHNTVRVLKNISASLLLAFIPLAVFSQGLINHGAYITNSAAYIYIAGGSGLGNFTNQDNGAFIGKVNNTGFIDVTGNWINNSSLNVFTANSGTVEMLGTAQNLGGTTTTWFNNLSLLGSGTKTMQINEIVGGGYASPAGVLALNDRPLALNTYKLTVNNPANTAITRTSGYIISETNAANNTSIIQWNVGALNAAYVFPFGIATSPNYIPLTITKSAGTANILASTRRTTTTDNQPWQTLVTQMWSQVIPGNGEVPVVIDRWWDINATASFTGSVSFTYRGVENTTTYSPTGNFSAQNWAGYWTTPVGTGPGVLSGTAVVTIPSQTLGSSTPWVLSNLQAPLPIELLYFHARMQNNNVHLDWSTASEINNDYFEVQRSKDNVSFETIDVIKGAGNSTTELTYTGIDKNPFAGVSYYRLRQIDFDGKYSFSQTVAVRMNAAKNFDLLYASASAGRVTVGFVSELSDAFRVRIIDVLGNEISNTTVHPSVGFNRIEIPSPLVTGAIYYLTISQSEFTESKKLFIN
jgi:hypothetical protein